MASTAEALDAVFARWARRERAPGLSWGLVRDGNLVASGGHGTLQLGRSATPDADSVFRIASMTKSFTGAALMTLVADGRLRLDDPVAMHVPELEGWRGPTTDGPPLTVRHLVSMESGLPTDDAWADRHIDLTDEQMDALITAGAEFAWTPGVRFEYSNLGWGLVGRVIERVAGVRPQELVSSALLEPLGMTATTWVRSESGQVAEPYRLQDDEWMHEARPLGDGTIAPMGGVWSTVRDLARWVGFFTHAFPPRGDPDDGPLPRWARREMQQLRRVDELARLRPSPTGPSRVTVTGYGIGLAVRIDERLGTSVGHSGGLPGYGSHMRWLPEHGVGVVALANVTYANMHAACVEALEVLADLDGLGPAHAVAPSPALLDAGVDAAALLSSWNDADADAIFADNVVLDEPLERRSEAARRLTLRHGPLEPAPSLAHETPMRGSFTTGAGAVRVEIGLNHEGLVQWLDIEDRTVPSTAPIVTVEEMLREAEGTAYVIVRPVADLADAFARWQGEALDRLRGASVTAPSAHATLKAFGSSEARLTPDDESRIVAAVAGWAATQTPIEMRAEGLDVFDEGGTIPVVRLARTATLVSAMSDLWVAAERERLASGYSDGIGIDAWIPHLSLAYVSGAASPASAELRAWTGNVGVEAVACLAVQAEVVAYDAAGERRLGTFGLGRA